MDTWDNDLNRAKQYIKRGDYEKARAILEMMPDNYIARDWLNKLNRKNLKFRHDAPLNSVTIQNVVNSPNQNKIPTIPLILIFLNMLFWAFLIVGTVAMTPVGTQFQATVIIGVFLGFAVLWLLYYLYWRFYWWLLALSWLMATCSVIAAFAAGYQLAIP
jgi:uncharacterized membrane protein